MHVRSHCSSVLESRMSAIGDVHGSWTGTRRDRDRIATVSGRRRATRSATASGWCCDTPGPCRATGSGSCRGCCPHRLAAQLFRQRDHRVLRWPDECSAEVDRCAGRVRRRNMALCIAGWKLAQVVNGTSPERLLESTTPSATVSLPASCETRWRRPRSFEATTIPRPCARPCRSCSRWTSRVRGSPR